MKQLTSAENLDDFVSKDGFSLLFFSASWCGPCQQMKPVVEGVASMMSDRFNTIRLDVDQSPHAAAEYGIRSVPTLMLVKDDQIMAQQVGAVPPQQLMQWLNQRT